MYDILKKNFSDTMDEFTPIPFWFWNDALDERELERQVLDFKSKGVNGFVIHPRIGIPEDIEYLSDRFMELVRFTVEAAHRNKMKVVLYDEAMYPSGSAHGKVVKDNPEFASRGIKMTEFNGTGKIELDSLIGKDEKIVTVLAAEKTGLGAIAPKSVRKLEIRDRKINFIPPGKGNWVVLVFTEGFSEGTIRGIHFGEDDLESGAPPSGDLLNAEAMKKFITLTHDRYYAVLEEYFGNTVIAMFTDEPCIMGRCHLPDMKPWTEGFLDRFLKEGNREQDLPALWLDAGKETEEIRKNYRKAINRKLEETYYRPISDWCEEHGIALTGHPEKSVEIGLLKHFHIPGQDIVWRWVAPEDEKGLEGEHSTMAKCSADAARHYERRRNANECFGCCGPDGVHWAFSADDMKWYLDWMFVRGVNLIYPHAFYYSVDGEKRFGERPPDVGPNNIWWKYYRSISEYIKRMCWLMSDSINQADIAILCEEDNLPWCFAKHCYQNQLEFNYLEDNLLLSEACRIQEGNIIVASQKYHVLLVEDKKLLTVSLVGKLKGFIKSGGTVIVYNPERSSTGLKASIDIDAFEKVVGSIQGCQKAEISFSPHCLDLRMSHVIKCGIHFYLLTNEGENAISGTLKICESGRAEGWDAWKGTFEILSASYSNPKGMHIPIKLERRESKIICIIPQKESVVIPSEAADKMKYEYAKMCGTWRISGLQREIEIDESSLSSWTEWDGMRDFTGTLIYETNFECDVKECIKWDSIRQVELDLGELCEIAHVYVNGVDAGFKMWSPYVFDIKEKIRHGQNTLRIEVTNSMANRFDKACRKSGLIGPVTIQIFSNYEF